MKSKHPTEAAGANAPGPDHSAAGPSVLSEAVEEEIARLRLDLMAHGAAISCLVEAVEAMARFVEGISGVTGSAYLGLIRASLFQARTVMDERLIDG